jgi:hypothetical protein
MAKLGNTAKIDLGRPCGATKIRLHEARVVPVEQMSEEASIKIGCAEEPVHDWEGQVHVSLHHNRLIVMGRMMAPDRIHAWL